MNYQLSIVAIVNNKEKYKKSRKSLEIQAGKWSLDFIPVDADKKGWNAATALNYGIKKSKSDWVVCCHQDVVFPERWLEKFNNVIQSIPDDVVIIGLVGIMMNGRFTGHIRDPHGHKRWTPLPAFVNSIDEHLIIVRRNSGILFDEGTPYFHCYGTDICMTAWKKSYQCIVVDLPVVHQSGGTLDEYFEISSEWLLSKWGKDCDYIISTCATLIYRINLKNLKKLFFIRLNRRISLNSKKIKCECNEV